MRATAIGALTLLLLRIPAQAADETQFIPADDPRFLYEGRIDRADKANPVIIWQASRIRVDFDGDLLDLRFSDPSDQCFFNAQIDGRTSLVSLRKGRPAEGTEFKGLGTGRHTLVLFKRSEATAGTVAFRGIGLAKGAGVWAPASGDHRLRMEFFGDSITAGACDEDGAADQWEDRSTHDNAKSYGCLAAEAFGADYRNVAVSGMGVAQGWAQILAGRVWGALYPREDSPPEDLSLWTPDVVFINLGENDDSFTTAHKLPFPAAYAENYLSIIRDIRKAHPAAEIVILRGGMYGGARSARLRGPWEEVVAKAESRDPRVSHFVFSHWSSNHPRVADHRAMADQLIAWLAVQPFMKARP
jgi:lysophospholipase L1-like esterase